MDVSISMKQQIEETLQCLVGLSFCSVRRAADLLLFHFGPRQQVTGHDGKVYEVGTYALHVQCAWRIVQRRIILAAMQDLYFNPRGEYEDEEKIHNYDDQYDGPDKDKTLLDEQLRHFFFQCEKTPIYVQAIQADDWGGLTITLNYGVILTVFPDTSSDGECWRFFKINEDAPHFVITGEGIEDQEEDE